MTDTPITSITVIAADETALHTLTTEHPVLGWPPDRKLRLFACGCCRTTWDRLHPACRRAVEAAERFADRLGEVDELEAAGRACKEVEEAGRPVPVRENGAGRRFYQITEHVHRVARAVLTPYDAALVTADMRPWRGDCIENDAADAARDRVEADVLGGPERPAAFDPAWRTRAAIEAAQSAYREPTGGRLWAVAAALAAAGCDDAELLAHCRSGAGHVRGCWALDRVLGRG